MHRHCIVSRADDPKRHRRQRSDVTLPRFGHHASAMLLPLQSVDASADEFTGGSPPRHLGDLRIDRRSCREPDHRYLATLEVNEVNEVDGDAIDT
jgi:hypothetical protein